MAVAISKNTKFQAGNGKAVYDSGNITIANQPGKSTAQKLVDGTQQSATTLAVDGTVVGGGNNLRTADEVGVRGHNNGFSIKGD